MVEYEKLIFTALGFIAGLIPKLYELVMQRNNNKDQHVNTMLAQLSKESQELRQELREENDNLKEQVDILYSEINKLRDENFQFKKRINELEIELITFKSDQNGGSKPS
jgi:peptidoglycan hydrolase CwlO-like protein